MAPIVTGSGTPPDQATQAVQVSRDVLAEVNAIAADPALNGVQVLVVGDQGESVTTSLLELAEAPSWR